LPVETQALVDHATNAGNHFTLGRAIAIYRYLLPDRKGETLYVKTMFPKNKN